MNMIENKDTVSLMKLFQENVKKDISDTSDIINLIQSKLQDFDLNLSSLKSSSSELTNEFANITTQLTGLDESLVRKNEEEMTRCDSLTNEQMNGSGYLMRSDSKSSFCESIPSDTDFVHVSVSSDSEEDYELEKSFVFVERDSSSNDSDTDEDNQIIIPPEQTEIEYLRRNEYKLIDKACNDLIDQLFNSVNLSRSCISNNRRL